MGERKGTEPLRVGDGARRVAASVCVAVVLAAFVASAAGAQRIGSLVASARATVGQAVRVSATYPGSRPGDTAYLQDPRGHAWTTLASKHLGKRHSFTFTVKADQAGSLRLRVVVRRHGRVLWVSPRRDITVTASATTPGGGVAGYKIATNGSGGGGSSSGGGSSTGGGPGSGGGGPPETCPAGDVGLPPNCEPNPDKGATLGEGGTLSAGQYLENAQYRLIMQSDGNFVEYVGSRALWASGTGGNPGAWVAVQSDGNVVVYSAAKVALWDSATGGNPGDFLALQPDANVVVYSASGTPLWASGTQNSVLGEGEELTTGEYLLSADRHFELVMQDDGNLVEYVDGRPLWASGTGGNPGAWAVTQSDGNVVVYGPGKVALWNSATGGNPGDYLAVQPDANLVVYAGGKPIWASNTKDNELLGGETLQPSQYLTSGNGYELVMQNDGNLVLYNTTGPLWASNTAGNPGAYAVLQGGDGNFVVYAANGTALWNSATGGNPGDRLAVQPDGNVVIYSSGGTGLFATNTGGGGGGGGGSVGERILAQAEKWVGTPYCFAGGEPNGPTHAKGNTEGATQCGGTTKGFDCTGLTIYAVYQVTGKVLTHEGAQAANAVAQGGQHIYPGEKLQPGDLVYFGGSFNDVEHVGVYAGGGMIWDANIAFWIYPDGVHERSMAAIENEKAFVGAVRF